MTDMRCMRYFLGVEVTQTSNDIFICQRKYDNEVLERFRLRNCSFVNNPIFPGCKLTKDVRGLKVDATIYKQMVESLMYLTATRSYLIYVVSLVTRFMEAPTTMHQQVVKRIQRYSRGTTELGLLYKREEEENLLASWDNYYARDLEDRKSTSEYVFKMSNGLVVWSSKKQYVVSLSTTEAEFISAAACAAQRIWMMHVLERLGIKQSKCIILCDNSSTIKLSKNPVMHGKSKHIHVRFHFLRELTNQ
ncbi:secreted RxLR effector protein 161-like [Lathyrus oleraceus]|uniref:secreted RxLR effector protein 161-like n=1 Tax=Pisum sativum TaxID=3888 RepID=UPI0021D26F8F|nr:secreted RxLR effector protein 161-like [Pisum sativum]